MPGFGFPLAGPLGAGGTLVPPDGPPLVTGATKSTDLGVDISVLPDLDPSFALQKGPRVLAEALVRRLITARGTLLSDASYGKDIRAFLGAAFDKGGLTRLKKAMEAEMARDERVNDVSVDLSYNSATQTVSAQVAVSSGAGPFSLTLSITDVEVALLEVGP